MAPNCRRKASALTYGAGFIVATLALHADRHRDRPARDQRPVRFVVRAAGGAIAATGLLLLVAV